MKFNVVTLVMFGAGVILVYSGIKNVNPKDVITNSLAGKSPSEPAEPKAEQSGNEPPQGKHPDTGTANV